MLIRVLFVCVLQKNKKFLTFFCCIYKMFYPLSVASLLAQNVVVVVENVAPTIVLSILWTQTDDTIEDSELFKYIENEFGQRNSMFSEQIRFSIKHIAFRTLFRTLFRKLFRTYLEHTQNTAQNTFQKVQKKKKHRKTNFV